MLLFTIGSLHSIKPVNHATISKQLVRKENVLEVCVKDFIL